MPGFLTHYLAGQNLKQGIPGLLTRSLFGLDHKNGDESAEKVREHEKLFNLGCQGPDIFFYYFPGLLLRGPVNRGGVMYNTTRGLGTLMHGKNFGKFIVEMASHSKNDKTGAVFAYTCGLVMHYALDSTAHPYVYARTTTSAKKIKNSADHRLFETAIDILMLSRIRNQAPNDFAHFELISAAKADLETASHAMSAALEKIYAHELVHIQVFSAMKHMIRYTKLLQTKRGLRKKILRFLELITIREPLFSSMMHDQKTDMDVLNLENGEWQAPWQGAKKANQSFLELYDAAVDEATGMCKILSEFVYGAESEETLRGVIGNKSLKTGEG